MAKYNYGKYSIDQKITYIEGPREHLGSTINDYNWQIHWSTPNKPNLNENTGEFTPVGNPGPNYARNNNYGNLYVSHAGSNHYQQESISLIGDTNTFSITRFKIVSKPTSVNIKGTFLETIPAEDGTYPVNGVFNGYWYVRGGLANAEPTITLTTTDNRTLYENDTININGNAKDLDVGNILAVKYSINNGTVRAITSSVSTGMDLPFAKSLTFKNKKLFDGELEVASGLEEGTQNILKVWAEDDQGGKSSDQMRYFLVVPNRPSVLTINPFIMQEDLINTEVITLGGHVTDPDGNTVIVSYKIGKGDYIQAYEGIEGDFTFDILLSKLVDNVNTITIQSVDTYGAITLKTLEVTKGKDIKPINKSVIRYKLNPPNITGKGVILWLEREAGDLTLDVEVSMTNIGEEEIFIPMNLSSTAYVREGIEEDEFIYSLAEEVAAKENIIIQITMSRTLNSSDKGIVKISGVLS